MKRLLGFIILVAIGWYGWKHYDGLRGAPQSDVTIENQSGITMARVRLLIGRTEFPAYDSLYVGKSVTQKFPVATTDGEFELHWNTQGRGYELNWTGGKVVAGPMAMHHRLQVLPDAGVVWSSAAIPAKR